MGIIDRKSVAFIASVVLLSVPLLGADDSGCGDGDAKTVTKTVSTNSSTDRNTSTSTYDEPAPDPDSTFTHHCDYLIGSGENEYSFVADATVKNTGNIGIVAKVVARWSQIGTSDYKSKKEVRVPYGATRKVNFDIRHSY
jgi:hypothetical protein